MPDAELRRLASAVSSPDVMGHSPDDRRPQSDALLKFRRQWLQIRNLNGVTPDPEFPTFDDSLAKR